MKIAKKQWWQGTGLFLACTLLLSSAPFYAQGLDRDLPLDNQISVPGGSHLTNIDADQDNVRDILRSLSQKAGFNLVLDDSVKGQITLSLNKVTVNQALQSIATLAGLEVIPKSGNIYVILTKQAAAEKGLNLQLSKVIKVHYGSAQRIAKILNSSLFAPSESASTTGSPANGPSATSATPSPASGTNPDRIKTDARTNSIIVVGTQREIELAEDSVAQLDQPRQRKTFYLSHSNALDVASMLASSVFNDGTNVLSLSSGSSGGGSGSSSGSGASGSSGANSSGVSASPLRVEQEQVKEGSGINNLTTGGSSGGSSSGSSGSSGGSSSSAFSQNIVLRGTVKSSQVVNISPEGPMVIPDTRTNSVTVLGTAEQIELAERLMPSIDAQLPQVAIEASLVEISEQGTKALSNDIGLVDNGRLQFGFNNQGLATNSRVAGLSSAAQPAGTGLVGLPTVLATDTQSLARTGIGFSTKPSTLNSDYVSQIRALVTTSRAKILANPTVVATHDTETVISIVDEIVRTTTNTFDTQTGTLTVTTQLGEAGIVLDILPKIGEDGTITMRIRPSVSTVRAQTTDSIGNVITLLSKRDVLAQQVRIQDGQTLVLGGLVQQTETSRHDKFPLLGDLPIAGALFRASNNDGKKTELVILITPHILNKTKMTPVTFSAPPERAVAESAGGN